MRRTKALARLLAILLALILVAAACGFVWQPLAEAFLGNLYVNSVILAVFILATLYCFLRVFFLTREVNWLTDLRNGDRGLGAPARGSLLTQLSAVVRDRSMPIRLSALSARVIVDSIAAAYMNPAKTRAMRAIY